jgi:hypothetical protein
MGLVGVLHSLNPLPPSTNLYSLGKKLFQRNTQVWPLPHVLLMMLWTGSVHVGDDGCESNAGVDMDPWLPGYLSQFCSQQQAIWFI